MTPSGSRPRRGNCPNSDLLGPNWSRQPKGTLSPTAKLGPFTEPEQGSTQDPKQGVGRRGGEATVPRQGMQTFDCDAVDCVEVE